VQWACEQFLSVDGLACAGSEWGCLGADDATKFAIADAVFDRYYQHFKGSGATCDFSGKASLQATGKWKYGRFDVRAQLPKGHGLWPAIWMLPTSSVYGGWPASGEIDIVEMRGGEVNKIDGTLHYGVPWPNNQHTGSGGTPLECVTGGDYSADFHVYSVVWTEEAFSWMVDGVVFHTEQLDGRSFGTMYSADGKPFDQAFHMILNVAVGGAFFGPQGVPPSEVEMAQQPTMKVDYVRVYQPRAGDTGTTSTDAKGVGSTAALARTCTANRGGNAADVCGVVQWTCEQFLNMNGVSCSGSEWSCSYANDETKWSIADAVFDRHYQHVKGSGACFGSLSAAVCPTAGDRCCVEPASSKVQASFDVILASETVESFDDAKQQSMKLALGAVLGVEASDITLTVTPVASSRRSRHQRALTVMGITVVVEVSTSTAVAASVEATVGGSAFAAALQSEAVERGVVISSDSLSVDAFSFKRSARPGMVGVAELPPPPPPAPICDASAFQTSMVSECAPKGTACQSAVHGAKGVLTALKSAFGCDEVSDGNDCVNFIVCAANSLESSGCPLSALPPVLQRLKFTRDQICETAAAAPAAAVCEASPCAA
jgi:beta-glucanase (GH16 family)